MLRCPGAALSWWGGRSCRLPAATGICCGVGQDGILRRVVNPLLKFVHFRWGGLADLRDSFSAALWSTQSCAPRRNSCRRRFSLKNLTSARSRFLGTQRVVNLLQPAVQGPAYQAGAGCHPARQTGLLGHPVRDARDESRQACARMRTWHTRMRAPRARERNLSCVPRNSGSSF